MKRRFALALGLFAALLLAIGLWRATTPSADGPRADGTGAAPQRTTAGHGDAPTKDPHEGHERLPPPPVPTVSSRYATLRADAYAEAVTRYAADGEPDGTAPAAQNLHHLSLAVAAYRSALLFHGSEHVAAFYETEVRLLARKEGPVSREVLQEEACDLVDAPRDCPPDRFPTCGTHDRLVDLARTLCSDPEVELDVYRGTDADFGRGNRR